MRIGVIGSGISGLSAAWGLSANHDVTVLESAARPGGHAWTVDLDGEAVDLGFMVFNTVTYPELCGLFEQLGIQSRESCMSFSVRTTDARLEYQGSSLGGYFARRASLLMPGHWGMLLGILRFNRIAADALSAGAGSIAGSFGAWCDTHRIGHAVRERFLQPIGSSMWSCSTKDFDAFPAEFVLRFMANHRMLQLRGRPTWRTVRGGSRTYVEAMLAANRFSVHCDRPVETVVRGIDGIQVDCADGTSMTFDHVVLACHADQALALVREADEVERDVLSCIPYTANDVVLHRDESLLPSRPKACASWNYLLCEQGNAATITYDLRRLQGLRSTEPVLATLNGTAMINPELIIERHVMHHPAYGPRTMQAQSRHRELIDRAGLSYCGAYWGWGFHEDGCVSGLRVSEVLDAG